MLYFVIRVDEDGQGSCVCLSENILLERLNERYWGDIETDGRIPEGWTFDMSSESGLLIIKGKAIVPKLKTTIKEFTVEGV